MDEIRAIATLEIVILEDGLVKDHKGIKTSLDHHYDKDIWNQYVDPKSRIDLQILNMSSEVTKILHEKIGEILHPVPYHLHLCT